MSCVVGIEVPHLAQSRNVFGMLTSDQFTLRDDADELVGAADCHIAHTSTNLTPRMNPDVPWREEMPRMNPAI